MNSFEKHYARTCYEQDAKDRAALKQRTNRQLTREQRRRQTRQTMALIGAVCMLLAALLTILAALTAPVSADTETPETAITDSEIATPVEILESVEEPEDYENEKIEAALFESGYFRSDIPLDGETQAYLRAACEETGVTYELALAVIWKETGYQNVTGDSGNSIGYMQVQPRWHQDRMNRLGVDDLSDPYGNFRVGCDYLAELLRKYDTDKALTAYNTGKPGNSAYATDVLLKYHELRETSTWG